MPTIRRPGVMAVEVTENRKLGLAGATYVAQPSCPAGCRFRGAGCYAEAGPAGIHTARLNAEADAEGLGPEALAENEAEAVRSMRGLLDLRLHVVGDCPTQRTARVVAAAAAVYAARRRRAVWTYTHARSATRDDWGGVSVLGSCETPAGVRSALRRGLTPALVVRRPPGEGNVFAHQGLRFVVCPYQTKGTPCVDCGLCLRADWLWRRRLAIAFVAHGVKRRSIELPVLR
jgi:hypothetical protein